MLEMVQEIVYDVTGKRGVTLDTDFVQDLELNSFDIINVIYAFEEKLNTTIPTRDVWRMKKVRDVIEYIDKRGLNKS